MPASSKGRIQFTRAAHPPRPWVVAGVGIVAATLAWMLWRASDGGVDERVGVQLHRADASPLPSAPTPPAVPAPSPMREPALSTAPAVAVAAPATTPPLPLREAVDSGRAQPVFLALMGARAVRVGQPLRIDITAESENDFAGGTLVIEFDAARLKLATVRAGTFMSQAGAVASLTHALDREAGRLTIDFAEQAGGPPVSGGGTLVTVEFTPTQRGEARLALSSAVLFDLNDRGVAASTLGSHAVTIAD